MNYFLVSIYFKGGNFNGVSNSVFDITDLYPSREMIISKFKELNNNVRYADEILVLAITRMSLNEAIAFDKEKYKYLIPKS